MDQQNQTFQECLSLYCITSFFLHFWIRKLQKTKNSVKTKHHHLQKKSSNCYQCISGFKYCSSPEISSSVLGIQDQGGGSLWSLFLGIVLEVEAKVKEGCPLATDEVTKLRKVALEVWQCWTKLWSLTVSVKLRASLLQYRECIKQLFWTIHPTPCLHSEF